MKTSTNQTRKEPNGAARLLAGCLLALPAAAVLTGCGAGMLDTSTAPLTVPGVALHGGVMGGQQPVTGSTIQLYAAGTTGYNSAAAALIASTVQTDGNGDFNITSKYTCPSASTQVYIVATGGNAGSGNNANLAMMAALGSCGTLSSSTYITINELTTVGSAWALAPFMTGPATLGTTSTNTTGLNNAFVDVNTLVNTATGATPGAALPSGATTPTAEINTLADILASCVNSAGGTGSTTPCGMLFSAATPSGGSAPTDTITAALDIARNPGHNVGAIYNLSSTTPPFQPTLASAPTDFTVAVNYTAGNFNAPSALAADASGDIWITNSGGNTVTELSHAGAVLSGSGYTGSFSSPSAIAFDTDGTVWVTNQGSNSVSRLNSSGSPYTGSPYTGGSLNQPYSISFDSQGTAWVANHGASTVTSITTGGVLTSYAPAGAATPIGVAVSPH